MSRLRAIWLVARRELLERGRSKGFLAGLVLTQVFVIGALLLQVFLASGENVLKIGIAGTPDPRLQTAIQTVASLTDTDVELQSYPDRSAAQTALETEETEGVYLPGPDGDTPGTVLFQEAEDPRIVQIVAAAVQGLRLSDAGINLTPPAIESIVPPSEEETSSIIIANIGVIFLFISIFSFGYWVLSGVIEEKQSRVVEVVLSTVRPRDLLMGKVFGIGLLGLAQLIVLVVTGLVAASLVGQFELPPTTVPAVIQLLIWFVLGYVLYSTLFGVLGALASRMEEASNVTMPVQFLAMGSYFLSLFVVLRDPDSVIAQIASYFPPAAPMVVPMRAAMGGIEWWEVVLAVAVTVAFIYGLFVIGARIYSGAVLKTTGRTRLRDAWRSSR